LWRSRLHFVHHTAHGGKALRNVAEPPNEVHSHIACSLLFAPTDQQGPFEQEARPNLCRRGLAALIEARGAGFAGFGRVAATPV
jgi:hypothetical protein